VLNQLIDLASCFAEVPIKKGNPLMTAHKLSVDPSAKDQMINLLGDESFAIEMWDCLCGLSRIIQLHETIIHAVGHTSYIASLRVICLSKPTITEQTGRDDDGDQFELTTFDAVMQYLDIKSEQDAVYNRVEENLAIELAKRQKLYHMVHAEVQIMCYLVKEGLLEQTFGYLGSSKHACFMCNLFCKSFGVETRGCDYDQYSVWKMPALSHLNSAQVAKLVKAILETHKALKGQLGTLVARPRPAATFPTTADRVGDGSSEAITGRSTDVGEDQTDSGYEAFLDQ